MIKLAECICDRCKKMVVVSIPFVSKKKKTKMHFCSKKCRLVFLKGRKYWNNKVILESRNFKKLMHDSEKCL